MEEECMEILKLQMKIIDEYGLNEFRKFVIIPIISPILRELFNVVDKDGVFDFPKKFFLNTGIQEI